ncbi:hypothetical protein [Enterococcus gilvus]|uniref:hypothetical protein n=1 Tax=Enterococcus gilvus TaxID=160453 RepID=UPI003ED90C45
MQYVLMRENEELVVSENKHELRILQEMLNKRHPSYQLAIVPRRAFLRGHLNKIGGTPVGTTKRRIRTAFDEETYKKLLWLHEEHKKRSKQRLYVCDTLKELIQNEYTIRKNFR